MKNSPLVKYPKDTETAVHYSDFIWLGIASFAFGGVCWYLGYLGAVTSWLENSSVVVSYLFYVLVVAITFLYIRTMIIWLDQKQSWLLDREKRFANQFLLCCLLPTVFLFWVIRPVAIPKDEWLWLPVLVLFGGLLLLNLLYTIYFYITKYTERDHQVAGQEQQMLKQEVTISSLQKRTMQLSANPSETDNKEGDAAEEIDLAHVKAIDPLQEEFLLNNRFLTKKIMYDELGLFVFENTNNTPIVKVYLKTAAGESIGCEQRSLNEVVRDTNGFVQKIGRYNAIALSMIAACYLLKGNRLRIIYKVPCAGKDSFTVSSKISKRIKEWVMLQVPIEKE